MKRTLIEEDQDNRQKVHHLVDHMKHQPVCDKPIPSQAITGVDLASLNLHLLNSAGVNDRIQCLLGIARQITLISTEQQKLLLERMLDYLARENDNDVKAMLILLIEKLSRHPNVNSSVVILSLMKELKIESTKVKWHIYRCIYHTLKRIQTRQINHDSEEIQKLFNALTNDLSNTHHKIRSISITLISLMPFVCKPNVVSLTTSTAEIQNIVSQYTRDSDPRVRKSALDALVQMHLRGCSLDLSIYNLSVTALKDDFEEVRMGGLNLMGVLSALYPEHRLRLAHEALEETTRLLDDAFNRVCDLVNDSAAAIRTKACIMLASYQHVGSDTLAQTFSKKIMSHLRRKVPKYKMQQKRYAKGAAIPVAEGDIDVESDEFRLLDSGACGAFIHGLEDEFMEVRNASIDSICELCMYNENLTKKAAEFLVDMFNDDIGKIRLNAIQSLRKIGSRSVLEFDEEQLEIAVGAFEDSDPIARQSAHELLAVVRLTEPESLPVLLIALEANIKRYPTDILSIFRCLSDVGRRHDDYIEKLIPTLLRLDNRYLPKEINVENITHNANVILIANACSANVKLLQTLPKYIFRHFAYFKSKYPDCLPDLRKLYKLAGITLKGDVDCLPMIFSASAKKLIAADADNYMTTTIDMLRLIENQLEKKELSTALLTIEAATRNFSYISRLKPILLGKSELAQLYLECYALVIKVKQSHSSPTYANTAQSIAAALLKKSYTIQCTFLGLSKQTLRAAMYFRIMANMIWMFGILKKMPISKNTSFNTKNMLIAFQQRVSTIHQEFIQGQFDENADDKQITGELTKLKKNLSIASELPSTAKIAQLYSFMMAFTPLRIDFENTVKRTTAEITMPLPNYDKPFKFNSEYPVKIRVESSIFNVFDTNNIAVEVILPDQSSVIFWPSPGQFKPITPYCYKMATDIQLLLKPWTAPEEVVIRIVQSFEPDLPGLDEYIMKYPNYATNNTSSHMEPSSVPTSSCVISEPLSYSLCPFSSGTSANSNFSYIRAAN